MGLAPWLSVLFLAVLLVGCASSPTPPTPVEQQEQQAATAGARVGPPVAAEENAGNALQNAEGMTSARPVESRPSRASGAFPWLTLLLFAVAAVVVVGGLLFWWRRRRARQREEAEEEVEEAQELRERRTSNGVAMVPAARMDRERATDDGARGATHPVLIGGVLTLIGVLTGFMGSLMDGVLDATSDSRRQRRPRRRDASRDDWTFHTDPRRRPSMRAPPPAPVPPRRR